MNYLTTILAALFASGVFGIAQERVGVSANRWTNSLGMVFVPVPNTTVAFCIWETRVVDYEVFVREGHWARLWPKKPDFRQETNHPVVNVSWEDAKGFCEWLTHKEHASGVLKPNQAYRLPTDHEWSFSVGLPREKGATAQQRSFEISDYYPWGKMPKTPEHGHGTAVVNVTPRNVGNYTGKNDGFAFTAPVGSYAPNSVGIYDLGGNVWEWCIDFADDGRRHILRGGSWFSGAIPSGGRDYTLPDGEIGDFGFRCVRADAPASLD